MLNSLTLFYKLLVLILFCNIFLSGCKEEEEDKIVHETGQVTDVEGNVYATIKIGDQWWMAENLNAKRFRNGDQIKYSQTDQDWLTDSVAAYCLYDNNSSAPGLLYNWRAATNEIAPIGWHIPSDDDWKKLEMSLGMSSEMAAKKGWRGTNEADKLKVEGTTGWTFYEGVWATNESGFNARAGGSRLYDGTWGSPALFSTGFWWTSTESSIGAPNAYYRYLDYKKSVIFRSTCDKGYGFSIRCVKD